MLGKILAALLPGIILIEERVVAQFESRFARSHLDGSRFHQRAESRPRARERSKRVERGSPVQPG
jgi:hypothetical protein